MYKITRPKFERNDSLEFSPLTIEKRDVHGFEFEMMVRDIYSSVFGIAARTPNDRNLSQLLNDMKIHSYPGGVEVTPSYFCNIRTVRENMDKLLGGIKDYIANNHEDYIQVSPK